MGGGPKFSTVTKLSSSKFSTVTNLSSMDRFV
jgi:hypothetical protein